MSENIPSIKKALKVHGDTLTFRDANSEDAPFIYSLRVDEKKAKHLSSVQGGLDAQTRWLTSYEGSHSQAYFIIEYEEQRIGTVRLYDSQDASFCWGSWILVDSRPRHAAMESALMVYSYAIDHLNFQCSHFDVRKKNERVWGFHERLGAKRVGETALDFLYVMDYEAISKSLTSYPQFLSKKVEVLR